jgi:C4-dicarboxylate-specific signal transduction histidine kinase
MRALNLKVVNPAWSSLLKWAAIVSLLLFILSGFIHQAGNLTDSLSVIALTGLTYLLYSQPVFKPLRYVLIAIAPYVIISVLEVCLKFILPSFFAQWKNTIDNISTFSVFWGIGVWVISMRQRKELDKANKKVAAQEKENQLMSQMKAELEIQVTERTAEITKQKDELEHTLNELKATQNKLIQSEKMASLGELTAGIAHEIQNPLNFVNNFSDVNREMIDEVIQEINKGDLDEAKNILNDIQSNSEKINFHGKRADAIVKSMLQHSRKSTGQKEPTDINALCDEYLRLSYHGLRAKDKSFNAVLATDFDTNMKKVNVVAQDLGRVLLNLFNNAFFAVNEKKKTAGESYSPCVSVQTKLLYGKIEIRVSDNGNGIPQEVRDKIFQPFFTTKPTGQGTGLGLSLSYDIIKAHGGEIQVHNLSDKTAGQVNLPTPAQEQEGTEFIIELPIA